MDKLINKRLSALGISDKELVEDKRVETSIDNMTSLEKSIDNMTSLERLRWLKEKLSDKKDNLTMRYDGALIIKLGHKIEGVDACIKLISYNK